MARWPLLTIPYKIIIGVLLVVIFPPVCLAILVVSLPYTLFYRSSNWSMRERDMPAIQLYIDHFQTLYPDLTSAITSALRMATYLEPTHRRSTHLVPKPNKPPSTIDFWPAKRLRDVHCIPCICYVDITDYEYSQVTALLCHFEYAGWPRRMLLAFLRDKVEQGGLVSPEEKEAFAVVMEKLCAHNFMLWLHRVLDRLVQFLIGWTETPLKEWGGNVPMGMRTVRASLDSVDWVLERGAVLIPEDKATRGCMKILKAFPMWKRAADAEDLEKGVGDYWQIMVAK